MDSTFTGQVTKTELLVATFCYQFVITSEKEVKKKISRTNFITIMTDGTTDAGILEQEIIYLLYLDPDVFEPRMAFFYLKELHGGQGADILKKAIEDAFIDNDMEEALQKIVFFGSDGTATNSGLNAGLITKLNQDFAWLAFIWCLSHRLELAMKDSLKDFMDRLIIHSGIYITCIRIQVKN